MKSRFGRLVASLAAVVAVAAPFASHAGTNPALDRCVQVFVEEVVPANHSSEIRREHIAASIKRISTTRSRVMLIARGEKHGKVFGRASCVIDRDGLLVGLYLYDPRAGQAGYGRPKVLARNVDATQDSRTAFSDDTKPF